MTFLVLVWLASAAIAGALAKSKGRDPGAFVLLGLVLGIFAVIYAAVMPDKSHPGA